MHSQTRNREHTQPKGLFCALKDNNSGIAASQYGSGAIKYTGIWRKVPGKSALYKTTSFKEMRKQFNIYAAEKKRTMIDIEAQYSNGITTFVGVWK